MQRGHIRGRLLGQADGREVRQVTEHVRWSRTFFPCNPCTSADDARY